MVLVTYQGVSGAQRNVNPYTKGVGGIGYVPDMQETVGGGTHVTDPPGFWDTFRQVWKVTPFGSTVGAVQKYGGLLNDPLDFWTGAWNPFNLPYKPQFFPKLLDDPSGPPSTFQLPDWPDFKFPEFPDLSGLEGYGYMALAGLALIAVIMFLK